MTTPQDATPLHALPASGQRPAEASEAKVIVLAAPSGTGKSTICRQLLTTLPRLRFSISATTRAMREGEVNGREYYFLSKEEFEAKIAHQDFIEYSKHFDHYYGTLKSEIHRAHQSGQVLLLDLDVDGSLNVKALYGAYALLIFISPPNRDTLEARLRSRGTETEESIHRRLARVDYELSLSPRFDITVVNDTLDRAVSEIRGAIDSFLQH